MLGSSTINLEIFYILFDAGFNLELGSSWNCDYDPCNNVTAFLEVIADLKKENSDNLLSLLLSRGCDIDALDGKRRNFIDYLDMNLSTTSEATLKLLQVLKYFYTSSSEEEISANSKACLF